MAIDIPSWSRFKLWLKKQCIHIIVFDVCLSFHQFPSLWYTQLFLVSFKCPIYHGRNMIEPTSKSLAPWKASCQWLDHRSHNLPKGPTYTTPNSTPISYLPYFVLTMQIFGVEDSMHHFIQTSQITCHVSGTNPCTRTSYTSNGNVGFLYES
jgi:hypothetical protein